MSTILNLLGIGRANKYFKYVIFTSHIGHRCSFPSPDKPGLTAEKTEEAKRSVEADGGTVIDVANQEQATHLVDTCPACFPHVRRRSLEEEK